MPQHSRLPNGHGARPAALGRAAPPCCWAAARHRRLSRNRARTWRRRGRCASIDDPIGLEHERRRNRETEGLRGLAIEDLYELGRLLDGEIGGSRAPQDLVDID